MEVQESEIGLGEFDQVDGGLFEPSPRSGINHLVVAVRSHGSGIEIGLVASDVRFSPPAEVHRGQSPGCCKPISEREDTRVSASLVRRSTLKSAIRGHAQTYQWQGRLPASRTISGRYFPSTRDHTRDQFSTRSTLVGGTLDGTGSPRHVRPAVEFHA